MKRKSRIQLAAFLLPLFLILPAAGPAWAAQAARPWDLAPQSVPLPDSASPVLDPQAAKAPDALLAKAPALAGLRLLASGDPAAALALLATAAAENDPLAPVAAYYHGVALFRTGDYPGAAAVLAGPAADPDFFLAEDARLVLALSLEAANRPAEALPWYAGLVSAKSRELRPLILLRAGVCAAGVGDFDAALNFLRELSLDSPWSRSVADGDALAEDLFARQAIAWSPLTAAVRLEKAETLVERGRSEAALRLLDHLEKAPAGADPARIAYLRGKALYALRKTDASVAVLRELTQRYPDSPLRPWAMYHEAKGLWRSTDPEDAERMEALLLAVLREYPKDVRVREVCARHLMLLRLERGRFAEAREAARLLAALGRQNDLRENAERVAAVVGIVLGQYDQARRDLEGYLAENPDSDWIDGAVYWMGLCLERLGRPEEAAAWHKRNLIERPNGYYGLESEKALAALTAGGIDPAATIPVGKIPAAPACPEPDPAPDASRTESVRRTLATAGLLEGAGFGRLAEDLLGFAAKGRPKDQALALAHMDLAARLGERGRALSTAWRTWPGCLLRGSAKDLGPLRDVLYPRDHLAAIEASLAGDGADPDLILGLVRQESFFNPLAVSGAGAMGLMQLMPQTAAGLCKRLGLQFEKKRLFDPALNIRLGVRYFLDKLEKYGRVPYALASYNAGSAKLELWIANLGRFGDALFTECVPYEETRKYVQRILANQAMYRRLYGEK